LMSLIPKNEDNAKDINWISLSFSKLKKAKKIQR